MLDYHRTRGTRTRCWDLRQAGGASPRGLLQRSQVDDEAVLYVALEQAFVGLVDLLNRNQLDIRDNSVVSAKIQHFLSLAQAADGGAREAATLHKQVEGRHRCGFRWGAHQDHGAIELQQL